MIKFFKAPIKIDKRRAFVEVADTEFKRNYGLSNRFWIWPDNGMIFDFGKETNEGFWMKNTYVPLSIAFLDKDGVIQEIHDMQPTSEELITPSKPYRYAIEMKLGWFGTESVGKQCELSYLKESQ